MNPCRSSTPENCLACVRRLTVPCFDINTSIRMHSVSLWIDAFAFISRLKTGISAPA
jgi:hypothetical protein